MNNICLIGRLCAEPELKTTQSGLSVATVSVAVSRMPGDPADVTDFIPCVFWRKSAEFVGKYFRKGDMIAITGSLQTRNYTDRYDNKRTAFEVIVSHIDFCGGKREGPSKPVPEMQREQLPPASDFPEDDEPVPF